MEAGTYSIDVKLAGTDTTVMSLGPTDIPADVDVNIKAKLSGEKTPVLNSESKIDELIEKIKWAAFFGQPIYAKSGYWKN